VVIDAHVMMLDGLVTMEMRTFVIMLAGLKIVDMRTRVIVIDLAACVMAPGDLVIVVVRTVCAAD
jgi:hypothetical protein